MEAGGLAPGRQTIAQEIVHHLRTGEPVHPTLQPDFNLDVMVIVDAALRSVHSGRLEHTQA